MKRTSKKSKTQNKTHVKKDNVVKKQQKKEVKKEVIVKKKELPDLAFYIKNYIGNKTWLIALGLIAIVAVFVFKDYIFHKFVFLFNDIGSDSLNISYPHWKHDELINKIGEKETRWSFFMGMGQSYGSDASGIVQTIMKFPLKLLNLPLNLLSNINEWNEMPHSIAYGQFAKIILIGIVFYVYLRTIKIGKYTSIIGSLLFGFSGYIVLGSTWYHTGSAFSFVFLLFAFEQFLMKKRWYFLPYAFFMLGGYNNYLYGLFIAIYAIFRFFEAEEFNIKKFAIFSSKCFVLAIIGIGISSPALINSFLNIITSPRGVGLVGGGAAEGVTSYAQTLSLFPTFGLESKEHYVAAIMRTFSNDIIGNGTDFRLYRNYLEAPAFYCGILTLLLIPQAFVHFNKKQRIVIGAFMAVWSILIIFPYFRYAYYVFIGDYYKAAMDYFVVISLLVPGLYALNFINKEKKKVNLPVLGGTLVLLLGLLYYPYFKDSVLRVDKDIQSNVRNLLLVYSLLLVLINYHKARLYAQIALISVLIFEVGSFGLESLNEREAVVAKDLTKKQGYNDYTIEAVDYINSIDSSFYRLEKEYKSTTAMHGSLNDAMIQGYYGTSCYSSFNQINYIRFLQEAGIIKKGDETASRWAPGLSSRPLLMNLASVKYYLAKSDTSTYRRFGYVPVKKEGDVYVYKNSFSIPFGFCYDKYITTEEYKALSQLMKDVSMIKSAVVEENADYLNDWAIKLEKYDFSDTTSRYSFEDIKKDISILKQDTLQITQFKNDHIKGKLNLEKNKILFISTSYDDRWAAYVDGKKTSVERIHNGLCGILVDKGEHEIEMKFEPPMQTAGKGISLVSFIIYILLGGYSVYRNREKVSSFLKKKLTKK